MSGSVGQVKGRIRVRGGGLDLGHLAPLVPIIMVGLLVGGAAWRIPGPEPTVGAVAPKSVFIVDGEPDDDLLDNDIVVHAAPEAEITGRLLWPSELYVSSDVPSNDWRGSWSLRIRTPQDRPIGVGRFEHGNQPGTPGESVMARFTGGPWTCAMSTGAFQIDAFDADGEGAITELAISVEHHCEAEFPAIYGEIRIASTVPVAAIDIDEQDVPFGVVTLGGAAHDETVTITNVGDVPQDLAARITGIDADAFTVIGDTCSGADIAPDAACTLTIQFQPVRVGIATAMVELDDATVPGVHTIRLTGSTQ
jgi:hypothetical protein